MSSTTQIQKPERFDFKKSLEFIQDFTPCSNDHTVINKENILTGGCLKQKAFWAEITESSDTLDIEYGWIDEKGKEKEVEKFVRQFLSIGDDLKSFYRTGENDEDFSPVLNQLEGYRQVRFPTPFVAACWAALSQRTPINMARSQKKEISEEIGEKFSKKENKISIFPSPERMEDNLDKIEKMKLRDRKVKTIKEATETFRNENLEKLGTKALVNRLEDVWGFGEWSSEFIAIRGFGRTNLIPSKEERLKQAVAELYDLEIDTASKKQMEKLSEKYSENQGYWAHYIRVWKYRKNQ
ncbi:MAG: DNA-3-methyladenine glycosylase [Candidatus Magasanikbacteria bacterium]